MGVEGQLVHLACMFVQSGGFDAGLVEVVQDDLAIGGSSCYMRAELAMRPLDIMDAQALSLPDVVVGIVEDSRSQIGLIDDFGVLHADGFEDLLASKHGMCAFTVDVQGGDAQACLVACILGVACADAAGRDSASGRREEVRRRDTWQEVSGGGRRHGQCADGGADANSNNSSSSNRASRQQK